MGVRRASGFTLIELMIVVAIIAIIAAVAIPSILNARKSAVETRVIAYLRTIISVNEQYKTRFGMYAPEEDDLIAAGYIPFIPDGVSNLEQYLFEDYVGTDYEWSVHMDPDDPGVGGDRYFYADHTGVIRVSLTGIASSASDPLD